VDEDRLLFGDCIALVDEEPPDVVVHPVFPEKRFATERYAREHVLATVMEGGEQVMPTASLAASCAWRSAQLARLPEEHLRFANPHVYKVGISERLAELRSALNPRRRRA